jgi:OFA family oxalate/formate antiporter-like MFS transporter
MKTIFYGWWVVLACFLIGLYVSSVVFYGFTAFFEPLIDEFGWSYTQVSFAASLRGLEMGVLAFPIGFLADRFGSRKLMLSGVMAAGCGLLLLSFTQSLAMFYASFLILAFGAGGCTSVVSMSAVANWFDKDLGKALGIMASGFGASGIIVPVIVWLISAYNWRITLIIMGLGMWALGIPLSWVIRNKPESHGPPDPRPAAKENPRTPLPAAGLSGGPPVLRFGEVLKNRSFLYLNFVEAIRMMIVSAVITHVMPYLSSVGIDRTTAGFVAAAMPICSIIGRVGFGWLADIFQKRYVMALGFLIMGAGILIFGFLPGKPWLIFPFLLLFSPSFGGTMVLRGAILREYFGKESFGKMIGFVMGAASIGGIIGPTLAGWGFDSLGSYRFIWLIFSGLTVLAVLLVWRVRPLISLPIAPEGGHRPRPFTGIS